MKGLWANGDSFEWCANPIDDIVGCCPSTGNPTSYQAMDTKAKARTKAKASNNEANWTVDQTYEGGGWLLCMYTTLLKL